MANMIMTALEGNVKPDKSDILEEKFKKAVGNLPPTIVKTYLAQDLKNPLIWRIITLWRSKKDLDDMRSQGTPAGVLMFRAAGSEPLLSVFEIKETS